ncbi:MAG TPA: glycosyl transferase family protein [Terracidiphilus sp.]|jgi:adsorption protein B|nr:glycosyl transferase family protein [Terracidiphilus sp.]
MTAFLIGMAVLYLLAGLDDLFMDLLYWCRPMQRWLSGDIRKIEVQEEELRACPEQWIAILVPAWDESAVIARMLATNCQRLEYGKYDIFVGTYPNDEATQFEVAKAAYDHPRVHKVVCPNPGPTSKADCLNWVVEAIRVYEKQHGRRYEIFVMQDSEDVVHPLALKLFNFLMPEYDMVQIPVVPFERPLSKLTSGVYLDEFAEFHQKNLYSRQAICGMVPSAGVGTAFGRDACDELADKSSNMLFRTNSLTEDYDFAFRLCEEGRKSCVANVQLETAASKANRKQNPGKKPQTELISTREYFPSRFRDAVRQRTRWTLGIVFQGWQHLGWRGTAAETKLSPARRIRIAYTLFRDRKGLLSGYMNMLAYALLAVLLGVTAVDLAAGNPWNAHWPAAVFHSRMFFWLVAGNLAMMTNRAAQRAISVLKVSTWQQALISPVRMLWATGMDLCSTVQSTRRYVRSRMTGEPLKWAKTAHEFPSEDVLRSQHRKLGELLLEKRLISPEQLASALEEHKREGVKLGQLLLQMMVITGEQLQMTLQEQCAASAQH